MNKISRFAKSLALAALGALATTATAGTFTRIDKGDKPNAQFFVYEGEIKPEDVKAYESLLERKEHIYVVIESGGGHWLTGMALGRATMRRRDEVTLVCNKAYSAAAMWFLADDDGKYLDDEKSEYGLHLPYVYGSDMTQSEAQTVGYMMGRYFEDVLGDEDEALKLMSALSTLQEKYGKFALVCRTGQGKVKIKK